ncbi:hypothetical protein, partial [Sphingobacterium sp. T2]|uniref:hypothetical protein n=1 Tax=Sphingobacterium sp. T2 TaxID=1590596 RepID=UPI001E452DFE
MPHNGWHIGVRAGFYPKIPIEAPTSKFTKNFQSKMFTPPDANMFVACCYFLSFVYILYVKFICLNEMFTLPLLRKYNVMKQKLL